VLGKNIWGSILILISTCITADETGTSLATSPFAVSNPNPFIIIHGLPVMEDASLLKRGSSSFQFQFDIANNSIASESARESIILDGETYRSRLIWKRGLGSGWQIGAELPLIAHQNGVMDNFIEGWHDLFGLSNRDRDPGPKNRLLYHYEKDGTTLSEISSGANGVGDLRLIASKQLGDDHSEQFFALHAGLKLPTGDADKLMGSGATELALWVSGAAPNLWREQKLGGYAQLGILAMDEADILSEEQRDLVWFASLGLHWGGLGGVIIKCQVDMNDAFYDSDLAQLGRRSSLLTVGGTMPLDDGHSAVDLSIGENVATDATPDFMINLAYRRHF
jgi:hypothetical protein